MRNHFFINGGNHGGERRESGSERSGEKVRRKKC